MTGIYSRVVTNSCPNTAVCQWAVIKRLVPRLICVKVTLLIARVSKKLLFRMSANDCNREYCLRGITCFLLTLGEYKLQVRNTAGSAVCFFLPKRPGLWLEDTWTLISFWALKYVKFLGFYFFNYFKFRNIIVLSLVYYICYS